MFKTSRLVRGVVAATSFLIAGSALAEGGTWQPEVGWGQIAGSHVSGSQTRGTNTALTLDFALGYRWDNGFGVRRSTSARWTS